MGNEAQYCQPQFLFSRLRKLKMLSVTSAFVFPPVGMLSAYWMSIWFIHGAGRAPWMNQMDIQYALNIPTGGKTKAEVTLNIFNFLNLLNKNWGWQYWASFPMTEPVSYGGIDKTTGLMIYNINNITASTWAGTFTRDDLRSRWQAQIGVRFRF